MSVHKSACRQAHPPNPGRRLPILPIQPGIPATMLPQRLNRLLREIEMRLDDRAIHDATQVISYFNYINRIADALHVEQEEFVQHWEETAVGG